jgi:hypothetical protein
VFRQRTAQLGVEKLRITPPLVLAEFLCRAPYRQNSARIPLACPQKLSQVYWRVVGLVPLSTFFAAGNSIADAV